MLGWLIVVGAGEARPQAWPPLNGELTGELNLAGLPAPGLRWAMMLAADGLELRTHRPGVDVVIQLTPETGSAAWRWTIRRGALDLGELWPELRVHAGPEAVGWSASGRMELAGTGHWCPQEGPTGELRLVLREGWARSEALGIELSGIEADLSTTTRMGASLPAGQILRVARATGGDLELKDFSLKFGVTSNGVVEVSGGGATLLGGRVTLRPFMVPLGAPALNAAADVEAVQLAEVARLMPWLLQTAQGRLRGRVHLVWDELKGLRLRDGRLDIVRSDDAAFHLAPSPGLLTGNMPKVFGFTPTSWTWASWIGVKNPAHGPLRAIELGHAGVMIDAFQVTFWPDGPGTGRPMSIHIAGRPTSGQIVEELVLDVNFFGPLNEAMGFGLNQEFTGFGFRIE